MDQLAAGIAGEGVIDEVVAVGIATENGRACGAGEIAAHATAALDDALDDATDPPARAHDAPGFVGADAIHLGGAPIGGDALAGGRQAEERVSRRVTIIVNEELEVVGIRAGEFAAVIIEAHTVLCAAGLETEFVGARVEPKIAPGDFLGGLAGTFWAGDFAAVAGTALHVDAVVLTPLKTVEHGLDVERFEAGAEAGERDFTDVGAAVAVFVLEAPDVGRGRDEESAMGPDEAGREGEVVGKDRAGFVEAVAVFVLEHRDAAEVGRAVALLGVVDHFADEHAAVFVEGDGDGIADLGFVGDQLDLEPGLHLPGGEGVLCGDGRVTRKFFGGIEGGAGAGVGGGGGGVGVARGEPVGGGEGVCDENTGDGGQGGEEKWLHRGRRWRWVTTCS